MATQLLAGNVIEVRFVSFIPEQIAVNRLFYEVENVQGAGADTDAAADRLNTIFAFAYRGMMPSSADYRGVSVQRIFPLPRTVASINVTLAGPGSALGGLQPSQVAALVAKRTDFAGRSFRGRAYVPFPADTFQAADGNPATTFVTGELLTFANLIDDTLTAGVLLDTVDLKPVLWKLPVGPATPVTQTIARALWATQRRRGGFGAKNALPF